MDTALQHLTDQILTAAAAKTPLTIRGHGSKDFYGNPLRAGALLDSTAYRGIVSFEPTELVVTVRAATPLVELEAALAEKGQCLAFEPPHFDTPGATGLGTCAGMVATALAGPSRASVGGVRDFVLGCQLLNGRGEQLIFGGQVMKNVAGYDVSRLMAGTLGTLGLLTEVSLKVLPVAPAEATLVFQLDQASALAQLHHWGAQPLPLNASCWVRDDTAPGTPELLFVRLRGAVAAVESAVQKMTQDVPGQRLDDTRARRDWAACRDQRLPFFTTPTNTAEPLALWRLSLPQTAPVLTLPWPQLIEWHGAQRWLWAPESEQARLQLVATQVGGTAGVFRSAGKTPTTLTERFDTLNPTLLAIHQRLKAEFDPAGIFNCGRLYSTL